MPALARHFRGIAHGNTNPADSRPWSGASVLGRQAARVARLLSRRDPIRPDPALDRRRWVGDVFGGAAGVLIAGSRYPGGDLTWRRRSRVSATFSLPARGRSLAPGLVSATACRSRYRGNAIVVTRSAIFSRP